jgi:hypothetical protein
MSQTYRNRCHTPTGRASGNCHTGTGTTAESTNRNHTSVFGFQFFGVSSI